VEFFGAFCAPLSDLWLLKLEYAYTLASWSPQGAYGPATISVTMNMPSVILQYMLTDRGVYNVKVGAGRIPFREHGGEILLSEQHIRGEGTGDGVEIEANTAFRATTSSRSWGEYPLGADRTNSDGSGTSPGVGSSGLAVTLHSFGAGARLGACYLF